MADFVQRSHDIRGHGRRKLSAERRAALLEVAAACTRGEGLPPRVLVARIVVVVRVAEVRTDALAGRVLMEVAPPDRLAESNCLLLRSGLALARHERGVGVTTNLASVHGRKGYDADPAAKSA